MSSDAVGRQCSASLTHLFTRIMFRKGSSRTLMTSTTRQVEASCLGMSTEIVREVRSVLAQLRYLVSLLGRERNARLN